MEVFENENGHDEVPYQNWRNGHLGGNRGYVVNTPRRNDPGYFVVHRPDCPTISNAARSRSSKPFTGEKYIKLCSEDLNELMREAERRGRADPPSYCKLCKPEKGDFILIQPDNPKSDEDFPATNPLEALSRRAREAGRQTPSMEKIEIVVVIRNTIIAKYAKSAAKRCCSLCDEQVDLDALNYLDCHHIEFLRNGEPDTRENVIGVCPNCHRRLHISPDPATVEKLRVLAERRASELDAAGVLT